MNENLEWNKRETREASRSKTWGFCLTQKRKRFLYMRMKRFASLSRMAITISRRILASSFFLFLCPRFGFYMMRIDCIKCLLFSYHSLFLGLNIARRQVYFASHGWATNSIVQISCNCSRIWSSEMARISILEREREREIATNGKLWFLWIYLY